MSRRYPLRPRQVSEGVSARTPPPSTKKLTCKLTIARERLHWPRLPARNRQANWLTCRLTSVRTEVQSARKPRKSASPILPRYNPGTYVFPWSRYDAATSPVPARTRRPLGYRGTMRHGYRAGTMRHEEHGAPCPYGAAPAIPKNSIVPWRCSNRATHASPLRRHRGNRADDGVGQVRGSIGQGPVRRAPAGGANLCYHYHILLLAVIAGSTLPPSSIPASAVSKQHFDRNGKITILRQPP
jgi:hypothetical protein